MKETKIQLPKEEEPRRCVLIVIENHIGVILRIEGDYAIVSKYTPTAEKSDTIVAVVEAREKSIDMVPRYTFLTVENIKSGELIEWDTAENHLLIVKIV